MTTSTTTPSAEQPAQTNLTAKPSASSSNVVAIPVHLTVRCTTELDSSNEVQHNHSAGLVSSTCIVHIDLSSDHKLEQLDTELRAIHDEGRFYVTNIFKSAEFANHEIVGEALSVDWEVEGMRWISFTSNEDFDARVNALAARGWRGHLVVDWEMKVKES